jgi:hypothetical protein
MARIPKTERWGQIQRNPTLHPKALLPEERGIDFPWHDYAHLPQSSQAFCLSAFGTLRQMDCRNHMLARFFASVFPEVSVKGRPRRWEIKPELSCRDLLGEHGRSQPTSIDVLCVSSKEVICVESKFLTDAREGFGRCSQASSGSCKGFFGPGSDARTGSDAWCRLENWEGDRSPRLYWSLGRRYFQPRVFEMQKKGADCPFKSPNYQLMRNFLFAAAYAMRYQKRHFSVLAISPKKTSPVIRKQLREFRDGVLRPPFRGLVKIAHYEDYLEVLGSIRDPEARELAQFLSGRIDTVVNRT